jgi:hypothetical protein
MTGVLEATRCIKVLWQWYNQATVNKPYRQLRLQLPTQIFILYVVNGLPKPRFEQQLKHKFLNYDQQQKIGTVSKRVLLLKHLKCLYRVVGDFGPTCEL